MASKSGSSRPFPELLSWHLDNGTHPDGSPENAGQLWTNVAFGEAVGVSDRTVRNWRTGKSYPDDIRSIESALFGDNPAFARQRQELRTAPLERFCTRNNTKLKAGFFMWYISYEHAIDYSNFDSALRLKCPNTG